MTAEEQVLLARPVHALEYFDGQIKSDNYKKGNLLNAGINMNKFKGDRGRSQDIIPVPINQSQAQSNSVA